MTIDRRSALLALSSLLAGAARSQPATDYPIRSVTVLAPFAAGGTVDIVARLLVQKIGLEFGQTFIVDNRGGAGGRIATAMLAHAAPDGYTLMVQHMGLAFNAGLYQKLPYDTRDVLPVAYIGSTPNVLVVTNNLPVKTFGEFVALAKAKPGDINYGSGGSGSAGHVAMEVLQAATGIKLTHVPYKGSGPAMVDLMAGQIQAMLLTIPAVMPYLQSGKLRGLVTSGQARSPALATLPTIAESGIRNFAYEPWYGLFAPRATPPAILDKLHASVNRALHDPEVAATLAQQGLETKPMQREQFATIVANDVVFWRQKHPGPRASRRMTPSWRPLGRGG